METQKGANQMNPKSQLEILAQNTAELFKNAKTIFSISGKSEILENAEESLFSERDIVYIAGPMTGKPLFNYVKFFGFAGLLKKEYGCTVLNPARQPNGLTYSQYLARAITDCSHATAILLLEGWIQSPGARKEYDYFLGRSEDVKFVTEEMVIQELSTRITVKS